MYYEVYIDEVFVTNLLMDYLILRLLSRFLRCEGSRARALLGAFLGAAGTCLILIIPTDGFPVVPLLLHGLTAIAMVKIGCNIRTKEMLLSAVLTLYFTAFLCGGFWDVLSADGGMSLKTFLLFSIVTYGTLSLGMRVRDRFRIRAEDFCRVTMSYQGKVLRIKGFCDTGNRLLDAGSGRPVSIVSWESLEGLFPEEVSEGLRRYQEAPEEPDRGEWRHLRPHFLTFQSVGNPSGMALAITLDEMCIHGEHGMRWIHRPVVAVPLGDFLLSKDCQIILNANLLE